MNEKKETDSPKGYNLSPEQRKAFDFLKEFYSPLRNRGLGRSYVIACVIIDTAISNPGTPIHLIDHDDIVASGHRKESNTRYMQEQILQIFSRGFPESIQGFNFIGRPTTIIYTPADKVTKTVMWDNDHLPLTDRLPDPFTGK